MVEAAAPQPRARLWRILLSVATVLVVCLTAANVYMVGVTASDIVSLDEAPRRQVAIVLGNLVFPGGRVSQDLEPRVQTALDLFRAGKVERIFLSGLAIPSQSYDEAAEMATWLEHRGVPRTALILDREGYRTAATMANAARNGYRDALICTQAYHLPRAVYIAQHAGIRATGVVPSTYVSLGRRLRALWREAPARTEAVVEIALRGVSAN